MRTLIAGFGNVLRGDDGFGVEVIRRLQEREPIPDVGVMEVGTAGIRLAQELLTPCDRLIIVDAMRRGGAPGTVYVVRVESVDATGEVDLHLAVPSRALAVAKALGSLPGEVFIVGCEPAEVDELTTELTPLVHAAVDTALAHVDRLLADARRAPDPLGACPSNRRSSAGLPAQPGSEGASTAPFDRLDALRRRDEILQIMFWLFGEGLGPNVAPADIVRFVDDAATVNATLHQLVEEGLAEALPDDTDDTDSVRYRLTVLGVQEGRRRFLDEFEPYLARHAHGECGTADCRCHAGGAECRGPG